MPALNQHLFTELVFVPMIQASDMGYKWWDTSTGSERWEWVRL